jgi:hypothetical protein
MKKIRGSCLSALGLQYAWGETRYAQFWRRTEGCALVMIWHRIVERQAFGIGCILVSPGGGIGLLRGTVIRG